MAETINLLDVLPIGNTRQYKLHLACADINGVQPLDEYVSDRRNWIGWNEWKGKKDDWTRKFVLSFIEFYPIAHSYLFGGVFEVQEKRADKYILKELAEFDKWEGRLICRFVRRKGLRGRAFYLESFVDSLEVLQILPSKFDGIPFCGYENLNIPFGQLGAIVRKEKQDWKVALAVVKGIYLILDTLNGKPYVGSAYSDAGIWSRLKCYIDTGHGWNDQLMEVIREKGLEYALTHFKFSLLQTFSFDTPDDVILDRESYWKEVLLSRKFGYNKN